MRTEVIQNPLVRDNLKVLSEAIVDLDVGAESAIALEFFCDEKTGQILYTPLMIPSHELITLILHMDIDRKQFTWDVKEGKLAPQAETHLQEMGSILKKMFHKIDKLSQLGHIHWSAPFESQEALDAIKATWHPINREKAEKLLLNERPGTYFFRKESYAATLQEILRRGLKKSIQCFTLTYLDHEKSVRDKTVVYVDKKWMFYDDDPTLAGPLFNSVDELLKSKSETKYPLLSAAILSE